ncbi:MAG: hemolysin family protein [Leptospirales bacterium]|nr:hemolysin family protein [Leptospirales bacterium]
MDGLGTDLLILGLLIGLNGFFSGSEIAVISVKRSRLQSLIESGSRRAALLVEIKKNPDSFFATVQIGVSLAGTLASVYGGARFLTHLSPWLASLQLPWGREFVEDAALVALVLILSYFTLVFGELIPKSLAHRYAEQFSLAVARPLHVLSRIFFAFTGLLTLSSNLVLRLFKDRTSFSETRFVEDEIRVMLEEGVRAGAIESNEHVLMRNVFELNDTSAREVMTPRVEIRAIRVDAAPEELEKIVDSPFSRIPVYDSNLDHIVGILHVRDLMRARFRRADARMRELLRPANFIPESMKIDKVLDDMRRQHFHIAIVVDEYGGTAGLISLEDILEEIVGEIDDQTPDPEEKDIREDGEGRFRVNGSCSIIDFNEHFGENSIPEADGYNTVAGFVIERLGRFPAIGERLALDGFTIELTRRVRQQLTQFRVQRKPPEADIESEDQGGHSPAQA